jgi:hypothetical protein
MEILVLIVIYVHASWAFTSIGLILFRQVYHYTTDRRERSGKGIVGTFARSHYLLDKPVVSLLRSRSLNIAWTLEAPRISIVKL